MILDMVDFILSFSRDKALGHSLSQRSCSSDYALVMRACVSHDQQMKTDEEEASNNVAIFEYNANTWLRWLRSIAE